MHWYLNLYFQNRNRQIFNYQVETDRYIMHQKVVVFL